MASLLQTPDRTVVVNITQSWQGPCKFINPIFEDLQSQYPELTLKVVEADQNMDIVNQFQVSTFPVFLVFKNGEKIDELEGAMKSGLIELLDRAQQA